MLGLLIGAGVLFATGAENAPDAPIGRYQLKLLNTVAMIIDTQTGQVWNASQTTITCRGTDGNFYSPK